MHSGRHQKREAPAADNKIIVLQSRGGDLRDKMDLTYLEHPKRERFPSGSLILLGKLQG